MAFPVLAGIGLGAKLLSGLFSKSEAEKQRERIQASRKRLQEQQTRDISETYGRGSRFVGQRIASARQRAGEQASALGRPQDVGAMLLPLESNIATAGSEMIGNRLSDLDRSYRSQYAQLDEADTNAGEDDTFLDYLGEAGGAVANYAVGLEGLKAGQPEVPEYDPGYIADTRLPQIASEPEFLFNRPRLGSGTMRELPTTDFERRYRRRRRY